MPPSRVTSTREASTGIRLRTQRPGGMSTATGTGSGDGSRYSRSTMAAPYPRAPSPSITRSSPGRSPMPCCRCTCSVTLPASCSTSAPGSRRSCCRTPTLWERAWLPARALTPSGSGCSARTQHCSARSPWPCCPVRTTNRHISCARHSAAWLTGCPRNATHGSGWRRPAGRQPSFARVRAASSGTSSHRHDRRSPNACPARLTRVSFSAAGGTDGRRMRSFPTSVHWSYACRIWPATCAAAAPASQVPSGLSSREDSCSFPATKCGLRAGPARESRSSAWNARRTRSTT